MKKGGNMLNVLREEKKYRMSLAASNYLYGKMSTVLHGDSFNGTKAYMVRSLYFDSIYDSDFLDKESGIEYRKKIRIRIYSPETEYAKIEIKEKSGTNQRKRSLTIRKEDANSIIATDYSVLRQYSEDLAEELYYIMMTELYRPKCMVQYDRKALIAEENETRITFDGFAVSNEGDFNLFDENINLYPVMPKDQVVLEVKYNHFLLSYIKDVLECVDKTEMSNSKYCIARKFGMMGEYI